MIFAPSLPLEPRDYAVFAVLFGQIERRPAVFSERRQVRSLFVEQGEHGRSGVPLGCAVGRRPTARTSRSHVRPVGDQPGNRLLSGCRSWGIAHIRPRRIALRDRSRADRCERSAPGRVFRSPPRRKAARLKCESGLAMSR